MRPRPLENPRNPWTAAHVEPLDDSAPPLTQVRVHEDQTREILSRNESPDLGFRYSLNPYRGCMHACAYCYARPTHEYLGFGAGSDFDTQIVIKPRAAELLTEAFERPSWRGELVVFSGATDPYQPVEATYGLTRACLEVCLRYRNPVAIITKAPLIERDVDLLAALSREAQAHVTVSIPFISADKARAIEPYVATPQRRLRVIETLARAGIPVGVNVAPLIPGLNDEEIAPILTAARAAGASHAGSTMLRLPGSVEEVFTGRLQAALPLRAERVLHRLREVRGGQLSDSRFGSRGRGEGVYADVVHRLFRSAAERLGFPTGDEANARFFGEGAVDGASSGSPPTTFRRPEPARAQLALPGLG